MSWQEQAALFEKLAREHEDSLLRAQFHESDGAQPPVFSGVEYEPDPQTVADGQTTDFEANLASVLLSALGEEVEGLDSLDSLDDGDDLAADPSRRQVGIPGGGTVSTGGGGVSNDAEARLAWNTATPTVTKQPSLPEDVVSVEDLESGLSEGKTTATTTATAPAVAPSPFDSFDGVPVLDVNALGGGDAPQPEEDQPKGPLPGDTTVRADLQPSGTFVRRPPVHAFPLPRQQFSLMRRYNLANVVWRQMLRLMSADPLRDDFYFQVTRARRDGRGGNRRSTPHSRRSAQLLIPTLAALRQLHRQRAAEAARTGTDCFGGSAQGTLGVIKRRNLRAPPQLLSFAQGAQVTDEAQGQLFWRYSLAYLIEDGVRTVMSIEDADSQLGALASAARTDPQAGRRYQEAQQRRQDSMIRLSSCLNLVSSEEAVQSSNPYMQFRHLFQSPQGGLDISVSTLRVWGLTSPKDVIFMFNEQRSGRLLLFRSLLLLTAPHNFELLYRLCAHLHLVARPKQYAPVDKDFPSVVEHLWGVLPPFLSSVLFSQLLASCLPAGSTLPAESAPQDHPSVCWPMLPADTPFAQVALPQWNDTKAWKAIETDALLPLLRSRLGCTAFRCVLKAGRSVRRTLRQAEEQAGPQGIHPHILALGSVYSLCYATLVESLMRSPEQWLEGLHWEFARKMSRTQEVLRERNLLPFQRKQQQQAGKKKTVHPPRSEPVVTGFKVVGVRPRFATEHKQQEEHKQQQQQQQQQEEQKEGGSSGKHAAKKAQDEAEQDEYLYCASQENMWDLIALVVGQANDDHIGPLKKRVGPLLQKYLSQATSVATGLILAQFGMATPGQEAAQEGGEAGEKDGGEGGGSESKSSSEEQARVEKVGAALPLPSLCTPAIAYLLDKLGVIMPSALSHAIALRQKADKERQQQQQQKQQGQGGKTKKKPSRDPTLAEVMRGDQGDSQGSAGDSSDNNNNNNNNSQNGGQTGPGPQGPPVMGGGGPPPPMGWWQPGPGFVPPPPPGWNGAPPGMMPPFHNPINPMMQPGGPMGPPIMMPPPHNGPPPVIMNNNGNNNNNNDGRLSMPDPTQNVPRGPPQKQS